MSISKTKYVRGIGCERLLWLDENMPEAAEASDDASVKQGTLVGKLAQDLFGPHEVVPYSADKQMMIRTTEEMLDRNVPVICEASFACEGAFCSVDLLVNHGNRNVDIVEVKSASNVEPEHVDDAAFQTWVLRKNGFMVGKVCIAHVDTSYIRKGDLDIQKLFNLADITDKVEEKQGEIKGNLERLLRVQEMTSEPYAAFGALCPECAYWKHCSHSLPTPNVFDLPCQSNFTKNDRLKLYQDGYIEYKELKARPELKARQQMTVMGQLEGRENLDKEMIREFLKDVSFPLYFLDFEGFNPAVPPYEDTWPYRQIPFQYSLHWLESVDGELKHTEFLGEPERSPCRELAEQLRRDIPKDVCVTVYNKSYEKRILGELADQFPELADHLLNIREHIVDLMVPFSKLYWYLPAMKGSYSIKYVLPALYPDDPDLDYHNLEDVHKGTEASAAFAEMADMSPEDRERVRANLLKYCGLDTYAMVKVWEALVKVAE